MQMLDNLEIRIIRVRETNIVDILQIVGGEPDGCGHRFTVDVTRQPNGWYLVQTNFNDAFESHHTFESASMFAMMLATQIDLNGFGSKESESRCEPLLDRG